MVTQHPAPYIHPYFASRTELIPLGIFSIVFGGFVDYVIITQSKGLGTFKYYLMNQTIWAQLLEVLVILLNPVFLNPYIAGYMAGTFQHTGSYEFTVAASTICFMLYINTVISITISLANRYVFTFYQQRRKMLENKYTFFAVGCLYVSFYCIFLGLYVITATDAETIRNYARNETGNALNAFYFEPSLIYISEFGSKSRMIFKYMFFFLMILATTLIISVVWFIVNVAKRRGSISIITKTAKSLILSSIFQALLSVIMLFTPIISIMFTWGFYIHNSATVVNALVTLLSFHGTVDMISTLYFVVPSRNYCKSLLWRITKRNAPVSATGQSLFSF
uniref:Serpentine Receptor, class T n=1 Tax=Panagrellus redivivus TaxID=6233 RepID=A0A7E4V6V2_PANRE